MVEKKGRSEERKVRKGKICDRLGKHITIWYCLILMWIIIYISIDMNCLINKTKR